MVHLQMNGFIGDNLFQYVAARIVAEQLGFALRVSHSKMKPESNVPQLLELLSHAQDAPLALAGAEYQTPVDFTACEAEGGSRPGDAPGHVSIATVTRNREPRRIEMRGYYQRYADLKPHKHSIRQWLTMPESTGGYHIDPQDIVLHVRWGDLVVFNLAMSMRYYTDLLQRLDYRTLYVCGVGINAEVRAALAPFRPVYIAGSPAQDFRFMLGFNRIIQSNSGFAWWAGFLSQAQEIYGPLMCENDRTDKMSEKPVNLMVDDEPRYHYVEGAPFLERDYRLRDVIASRHQLRKKRVASSLLRLAKRCLR